MTESKVILEEVDEAVGGGVVGVDLCGVLQLSLNLLGELFSQFDPNRGETMGSGIRRQTSPVNTTIDSDATVVLSTFYR
ncbi:hypothetical protein EYF80_021423 [Liparis tanakae]|uniref:Uncharacterized protein n=1 Tax=Liparis tanakae TaxID=230148 RepID=A0A4Z2HRW4_9TELE|nr:hypothetical protein EYF80_021423 [Liparis tanakae]